MMLMTSFAVRGQDAQIRYLGHVGLGWLGESELDWAILRAGAGARRRQAL